MPAAKTVKSLLGVHYNNPVFTIAGWECLESSQKVRTDAAKSLWRWRQLIIIPGEFQILSFRQPTQAKTK